MAGKIYKVPKPSDEEMKEILKRCKKAKTANNNSNADVKLKSGGLNSPNSDKYYGTL